MAGAAGRGGALNGRRKGQPVIDAPLNSDGPVRDAFACVPMYGYWKATGTSKKVREEEKKLERL